MLKKNSSQSKLIPIMCSSLRLVYTAVSPPADFQDQQAGRFGITLISLFKIIRSSFAQIGRSEIYIPPSRYYDGLLWLRKIEAVVD